MISSIILSDRSSEYPVILADSARWRAFWWYQKSSGWPTCPHDVLQGMIQTKSSSVDVQSARIVTLLYIFLELHPLEHCK